MNEFRLFEGDADAHACLPEYLPEMAGLPQTHAISMRLAGGSGGAASIVVPNFHKWRAGDVLLCAADRPSKLAALARRAQFGSARVRNAQGAHWGHAGIYDGDGHIWDTNPKRDFASHTFKDFFAPATSYLLLRLGDHQIDSDRLKEQIAMNMDKLYGVRDLGEWINIAVRFLVGSPGRAPGRRQSQGAVCSQMVVRILEGSSNYVCRYPFMMPADFVHDTSFRPVPVCWMRFVPHQAP